MIHEDFKTSLKGRKVHYHNKYPRDCQKAHEKLMEHSGNNDIMPGDKVLVADHSLYKNDIKTPWETILRPGTVVSRYGMLAYSVGGIYVGHYPDIVDVEMDEPMNNGTIKNVGNFTYTVKRIKSENLVPINN